MSVKKEYVCLAHGPFECDSDNPLCKFGCDTVERRFFTPPAFGSSRTKGIDGTLNSLAKSYGLTDMGEKAMRRKTLAVEQDQRAYREYCERRFGGIGWGSVPKGGNLNVQTGFVEGGGAGAMGAMASAGATQAFNISQNKDVLEAMKRPVMVKQDHENLSIANVKAA